MVFQVITMCLPWCKMQPKGVLQMMSQQCAKGSPAETLFNLLLQALTQVKTQKCQIQSTWEKYSYCISFDTFFFLGG